MKKGEITTRRRPVLWAVFSGLIAIALQMAAPAYPAARLVVEPIGFDCGVVDEGVPATMQVSIANVGEEAALIKNVQTN